MQRSPPVLLVLLMMMHAGMGRGSGSGTCVLPPTSLAARLYAPDDGAVTALVYAGHAQKSVPLQVAWTRALTPPASASASVLLPADSPLVADDLPAGWYDGASPLTYERLLSTARGQSVQWHAAAVLPNGSRPVLALEPHSALWYRYAAAVFSGTSLHLYPHSPYGPCTPHDALVQAAPRHTPLSLPQVLQAAIRDDTSGRILWARAVTVRLDPDAGQTRLSADLLTSLSVGDKEPPRTLVLRLGAGQGGDWVVARTRDTVTDVLLTHTPAGEVVLGRRLLRTLAAAWAVGPGVGSAGGQPLKRSEAEDGSGPMAAVALLVTPTGAQALPDGVDWSMTVGGLFMACVMAYWTTMLARFTWFWTPPLASHARDPTGLNMTRARVMAVLGLVVSIVLHGLALAYAGRGPVLDTGLAADLQTYTLIHACVSGAYALVLVAVLVHGTVMRPVHGRAHRRAFAVVMAGTTGRAVLASLLVAAGRSMFGLMVTTAVALGLVFYPSVVATWVGLSRALGKRDREPLNVLLLIVVLGAAVTQAVTLPLYLMRPWLAMCNSLYSPRIIDGAIFLFLTVALAAATGNMGLDVMAAYKKLTSPNPDPDAGNMDKEQ